MLEVSPSCPATIPQLVAGFPLPQGSFAVAQLAMHRLHLQWGIPVVSKDASRTDAALGAWHRRLHADIQGGDTSVLELFPVVKVSVLVRPAVASGLVGVTPLGEVISVSVPAREGRSIELVVAHHLQDQFPELRVLSNSGLHTVRFETDLRAFTVEDRATVGTLLFTVGFVGDNVSSLPRYESGHSSTSTVLLRSHDELLSLTTLSGRLLRMCSASKSTVPTPPAVSRLPLHVTHQVELRQRLDSASTVRPLHVCNTVMPHDLVIHNAVRTCKFAAADVRPSAVSLAARPSSFDKRLEAYAEDFKMTFL